MLLCNFIAVHQLLTSKLAGVPASACPRSHDAKQPTGTCWWGPSRRAKQHKQQLFLYMLIKSAQASAMPRPDLVEGFHSLLPQRRPDGPTLPGFLSCPKGKGIQIQFKEACTHMKLYDDNWSNQRTNLSQSHHATNCSLVVPKCCVS